MLPLKTLDLFSGIGGNSLALYGLAEAVMYCEQDPHALAVLRSRQRDGLLPVCGIHTDVKTLTASALPCSIDLLVAGFPCQDISVAGRGEGIKEGNRSGLFYEIMRLTDELKPRLLFLENVPAIRTRGLDTVLRELTQRGYNCCWTMLSASSVGAPHKRERWFLLAHAHQLGLQKTGSGQQAAGSARKGVQPITWTAQPNVGGVANGPAFGVDDSLPGYLRASHWQEEPEGIPRITEEKEQRVERIKRLGNGVVPLQARTAFLYLWEVMHGSAVYA
jgi:DNA (cytosine-5)-methyltransferase 1